MASKRKPEGLELVLTPVLASILTVITVVPLFTFLEFTAQVGEVAVTFIVFGAWLLAVALAAPLFQKREKPKVSLPGFRP